MNTKDCVDCIMESARRRKGERLRKEVEEAVTALIDDMEARCS